MKCSRHGAPTSTMWCTRGTRSCTRTARIAIANVAAYHDDLETVQTRRTRYGLPTKGSIGKVMPLGVDSRFVPGGKGSKARDVTRNTVTTWARALLDDRPQLEPPRDSVHAVCAFFERNLASIAVLPWADDFLTDMLRAERLLRDVVDRPAESWYAGRCGSISGADHNGETCACACHNGAAISCDIEGGCGLEFDGVECTEALYAEPGNPFVRCKVCGTSYSVDIRRDALLDEAEDYEATVTMLARVITTLGKSDSTEKRIASRITTWVHRGRISSNGTRVVNGKLRPTYRVGDVLDLIDEDASA